MLTYNIIIKDLLIRVNPIYRDFFNIIEDSELNLTTQHLSDSTLLILGFSKNNYTHTGLYFHINDKYEILFFITSIWLSDYTEKQDIIFSNKIKYSLSTNILDITYAHLCFSEFIQKNNEGKIEIEYRDNININWTLSYKIKNIEFYKIEISDKVIKIYEYEICIYQSLTIYYKKIKDINFLSKKQFDNNLKQYALRNFK